MPSMTREQIAQRKADVVDRFGPWMTHNLELGHGIWTMAPDVIGAAEKRVSQVAQVVSDIAQRPLEALRILDLGCHEGGFAIELARRGAEVVAVEGREAHVEKARLAAEALALDRLRILHADIRELDDLDLGEFDVVLALGVIYHLPAEEVFRFAEGVAAACRGFALVEGQVALRGKQRHEFRGDAYLGRPYPENPYGEAAALDATTSTWLTKPSLLNLLTEVGFTSVYECRTPFVPEIAAFRDHVVLLAVKGQPVDGMAVARWPERMPTVAHPAQGWRHALQERFRRLRGGGLAGVFRKPRA